MKDFHVAPVEQPEEAEPEEGGAERVAENPLDRFRRISKLVASQSANIKWNEVIKSATIEAHSQIGRCRNRESFKNQQNLLRAMEQARKLIEKAPMALSPSHSINYDVMDQTNQTLVQLLKNISEEINEISPNNTLRVGASGNRSVTPLASLNAQLQTLIGKNGKSPNQTMARPKILPLSPKPTTSNARSASMDGTLSPPSVNASLSPKSSKSRSETPKPPFKVESPETPFGKPSSILKNRSPTPESAKSLDDVKSLKSFDESTIPSIEVSTDPAVKFVLPKKPDSPKLIDLRDTNEVKTPDGASPLKQSAGSPVKVIKRKAPAPLPCQDISLSRPTAPKIQSQGMIPPPPEVSKPAMQIPILSTTPATPLFPMKPMMAVKPDTPEPIAAEVKSTPETLNVEQATVVSPEPKIPPPGPKVSSPEPKVDLAPDLPQSDPPAPAMIATSPLGPYSSTEKLMANTDATACTSRAPSPACLRVGNKIEDVKTIKRQTKTGWL